MKDTKATKNVESTVKSPKIGSAKKRGLKVVKVGYSRRIKRKRAVKQRKAKVLKVL